MDVTTKFSGDEKDLIAAMNRIERQNTKLIEQNRRLAAGARRTKQETRGMFDAAARSASKFKSLLAGAAGIGSITGAIALINRGYSTWLKNQKEIATGVKGLVDDYITFAALQEPGTKRQRTLEVLEAAQPFAEKVTRAQALDITQAMESAFQAQGLPQAEAFIKGKEAAETVFQAALTGIPAELGKELEVVGIALDLKPGETIRMAQLAGEASQRTPQELAPGVAGLAPFEDKQFAMAFMSGIIGQWGSNIPVYARRGGLALSDVGPLREFFEETEKVKGGKKGETITRAKTTKEAEEALGEIGITGVPDEAIDELIRVFTTDAAAQRERLTALHDAGISTIAELDRLGMTEIREAGAIETALKKFDEIEFAFKEIKEKARPGLFVQKRKDIEAEFPEARASRLAAQSARKTEEEALVGAMAGVATKEQQQQLDVAAGLRRMGYEQALGFDLIEDEKATSRAVVMASVDFAARRLLGRPLEERARAARGEDVTFFGELKQHLGDIRQERAEADPFRQTVDPQVIGQVGQMSSDFVNGVRELVENGSRQTEVLEAIRRALEPRPAPPPGPRLTQAQLETGLSVGSEGSR